jgi:hypothetical protein
VGRVFGSEVEVSGMVGGVVSDVSLLKTWPASIRACKRAHSAGAWRQRWLGHIL